MMALSVLWSLAACGGEREVAPVDAPRQVPWELPMRPEHLEIVGGEGDVARLDGRWAEVRGTVTRTRFVAPVPRRRDGAVEAASDEGTALVLDDGTALLVKLGAPPAGWEGLIGQRVSVIALIWTTSPREAPGGGASNQPSISSWETPQVMVP